MLIICCCFCFVATEAQLFQAVANNYVLLVVSFPFANSLVVVAAAAAAVGREEIELSPQRKTR